MTNPPIDQHGGQEDHDQSDASSGPFRWTPLVLLLLIVGVGYYAYSAQRRLQEQIATVERASNEHVTAEMKSMRDDISSLTSSVKTLNERVGATSTELAATSKLATNLRGTNGRLAKTVAANSAGLTAVRSDTATQLAAVNTTLGTVSTDVKGISKRLDSTQADVAADRRQHTETATRLSGLIDKNASNVAELQRKNGRDIFEFDIRKSDGNDVARVEDIRIQLAKVDVGRSKYNIVLYMDDHRVERKDLLINQAIQFVVGKDRIHYELVVTAVDRDRIRGYVSVPKERPPMIARSS